MSIWNDAKIEKPKTIDPVWGLTTSGYMVVVQWIPSKGMWYELSSDETYQNVRYWKEANLPHGWNISDDYYEGVDE